jgi:Predicted kinase
MKSSETSKPHLVMIYGAPGSGKSFFADKFSEAFRAPYVDVNELRYKVFKKPSFSDDESRAMTQIGLHIVSKLLKSGQTVVLEGGTDTVRERNAIKKLAGEFGYRTLLVWIQTDLATTKKRAVSKTATLKLSQKQFDEYVSKLELPTRRENPVVISGKHTFTTQIRIVLGQLSK